MGTWPKGLTMKYKLRRLEWGIKGLIYLVYAFMGFGGGNNWGSCLDLGFQLWPC